MPILCLGMFMPDVIWSDYFIVLLYFFFLINGTPLVIQFGASLPLR